MEIHHQLCPEGTWNFKKVEINVTCCKELKKQYIVNGLGKKFGFLSENKIQFFYYF